MGGTVGQLFDEEPGQWGLRGDPFLWRDLRQTLGTTGLPACEADLRHVLEAAFREATGEALSTCDAVLVERFAKGGMSSGQVSGDFWRNRGLPLVLERYRKAIGP
ncbi:hypothetical protein [Histidinibacterium lentulum]|uniref:Uncharacterized protein n=1 Tax=Histidinibacterium lentulum TaxID=2480588 RepID=A0A3N2QTS7_9RHOB|nr:hypothetical protein [Histidinibacterium lentulum]ROT98626.1 hypothetical protein EAT49_16960 [Histidinibacterium lentulum]